VQKVAASDGVTETRLLSEFAQNETISLCYFGLAWFTDSNSTELAGS